MFAGPACDIVQLIGLPEGLFQLYQATIYAQAPKSNNIKRAYHASAATLPRPRANPFRY